MSHPTQPELRISFGTHSQQCTLGPKKRTIGARGATFHYFGPSANRLKQTEFFRDAKLETHAGPKERNNRHASAKVHYFGPSANRPGRAEFFPDAKSEMHAGAEETKNRSAEFGMTWGGRKFTLP